MIYESYSQPESAKAIAIGKLDAEKVSQLEDVMQRLVGAIENIEETSSRLRRRLATVVSDSNETKDVETAEPVSLMLDSRLYQLTKRVHRVDYALSKMVEGLIL